MKRRGYIISAFTLLILTIVAIAGMFILGYILPQVDALYSDFGVTELPFFTRLLVGASRITGLSGSYIWVVLSSIVMCSFIVFLSLGLGYILQRFSNKKVILFFICFILLLTMAFVCCGVLGIYLPIYQLQQYTLWY